MNPCCILDSFVNKNTIRLAPGYNLEKYGCTPGHQSPLPSLSGHVTYSQIWLADITHSPIRVGWEYRKQIGSTDILGSHHFPPASLFYRLHFVVPFFIFSFDSSFPSPPRWSSTSLLYVLSRVRVRLEISNCERQRAMRRRADSTTMIGKSYQAIVSSLIETRQVPQLKLKVRGVVLQKQAARLRRSECNIAGESQPPIFHLKYKTHQAH